MLKNAITKYGEVEGVLSEGGYALFKGVPYAAPPVGNLRGAGYSAQAGACAEFKTLLEQEGFEVTEFVPPTKLEGGQPRSDSFRWKTRIICWMRPESGHLSTPTLQTVLFCMNW